jgi:cell fate (sporulation/competence/biofilm development) regulator YlbF (YheA/YmcA/DUF963 family)
MQVGAGLSDTFMETTAVETTLIKKTRELCQALVDEPQMQSIRQRIDAFMADDKARTQYDELVSKGQELQEKQRNSLPLAGDEISNFEAGRDALLADPVARGFLDAQEELQEVRNSIQKYISRTIELGRVPTEEDMESCCEGGCGCGSGHSH